MELGIRDKIFTKCPNEGIPQKWQDNGIAASILLLDSAGQPIYMRTEHIVLRIAVLVIGLWIMALGVAFSIAADLGTSPISSVPYTVSMFTPLTVGVLTIIMHAVFISLQILILRKDYSPVQLLQLPIALVFGLMTDAAVFLLSGIAPGNYFESLLFCLGGIILVAAGVTAEVASDTVPLAGEGLALALSKASGRKFSSMKIAVDSSLVIASLILSFIFLHSSGGVREGTVFAAIFVGLIARYFTKSAEPLRRKYL